MILRAFNRDGRAEFAGYLRALRSDGTVAIPEALLEDPRYTEPVHGDIEIDTRDFVSKYEAGCWLNRRLSAVPERRLRVDVGLWAWLALRYFDQLCPADGHGRRKPKDQVKYIPRAGDHRSGLDKHLLFFPWKMCRRHGGFADYILSKPLDADPRVQREWTGYNLNVAQKVIALGRKLYWDETDGELKAGVTSSSRRGNLRRYVQLLKQLELTFDIHGMGVEDLQALLPADEYRRWLDSESTVAGSHG